jgi:predicted acyl esterase
MKAAMSEQISVDFDVPATMRDGVILRANIFRPAGEGPYPVALARTPYGKDFMSVMPFLDAVRLARAGYIVAIQDVRGRFRRRDVRPVISRLHAVDGGERGATEPQGDRARAHLGEYT